MYVSPIHSQWMFEHHHNSNCHPKQKEPKFDFRIL